MNKVKVTLSLLSGLFLCTVSMACIDHANHCQVICKSNNLLPESLGLDSDTNATKDLKDDLNVLPTEAALILRDNTRIEKAGLFGFFVSALKSIAIWGGIKLTNWVKDKIFRRARTYEYRSNDPGVIKAANHWNDLLIRTNCSGREPDHNPHKAGFQSGDDCPICSKQLHDLRT